MWHFVCVCYFQIHFIFNHHSIILLILCKVLQCIFYFIKILCLVSLYFYYCCCSGCYFAWHIFVVLRIHFNAMVILFLTDSHDGNIYVWAVSSLCFCAQRKWWLSFLRLCDKAWFISCVLGLLRPNNPVQYPTTSCICSSLVCCSFSIPLWLLRKDFNIISSSLWLPTSCTLRFFKLRSPL